MLDLESAIKHCEEVAIENDKLCKRYDDASRYSRSHNKDIVSANAKRCLECFECAKEHRQLAEWLKDYKRLKEQEPVIDKIRAEIAEIPKKYPMTMDYENGLKEALAIIDKYKSEIPTGSTIKNDLAHSLCDSCINVGCIFQSGIVRKECAFYMPPQLEPTTKNDLGVDSISREQAKAAIRDKFKDLPSRVEINTILNELPSVNTQEPRTGHWIEGRSDNPNIHNILCSRCLEGYPSKGHANSQHTKEKFKWCPNCGAYMIGESEK